MGNEKPTYWEYLFYEGQPHYAFGGSKSSKQLDTLHKTLQETKGVNRYAQSSDQKLGALVVSQHHQVTSLDKGISQMSDTLRQSFQELNSGMYQNHLEDQKRLEELNEATWEGIKQQEKGLTTISGVALENTRLEEYGVAPLMHLLARSGYLSNQVTKELDLFFPQGKELIKQAEQYKTLEENVNRIKAGLSKEFSGKKLLKELEKNKEYQAFISIKDCVRKLNSKESNFFWEVYGGQSMLDEETLQVLAYNQWLSPRKHKEIMQERPEYREGLTGVNIWLNDLNSGIRQGFSSLTQEVENVKDGVMQIDQTLLFVGKTIDNRLTHEGIETRLTIQNEALLTREVVAKSVSHLEQSVQTGFEQTGQIVAQSANFLGEKLDWMKYIGELALEESFRQNKTLSEMNRGIVAINNNILAGNRNILLIGESVLDSLKTLDYNASIRHHETQQRLSIIGDILAGIHNGIIGVRSDIQNVVKTLIEKDDIKAAKLFKSAEKAKKAGRYDEAIKVYEYIVSPVVAYGHVLSYLSLVDCYLAKGEIDEALEYAEQATIHSDEIKGVLKEFIEMRYAGLSYQKASEKSEGDIKKEKYREIATFLDNTGDYNDFSYDKKLNYAGCLYAAGYADESLLLLKKLILQDNKAILRLRNIPQFEEFFKGEFLSFYKDFLSSNYPLTGGTYHYLFNEFALAKDLKTAKQVLAEGITKFPSVFVQKKIHTHPLVKTYFLEDIKDVLSNIENNPYIQEDRDALIFLKKELKKLIKL